MGLVTGAGVQVAWGDLVFDVTSLSYNVTASGEVDITSMSSVTYPDTENTGRFGIHKDFDHAISECEIQIEFLADSQIINGANPNKWIGSKRNLSFQFAPNDGSVTYLVGGAGGFMLNSKAALTSFSLTDSVGEFVRGSATFRLSED